MDIEDLKVYNLAMEVGEKIWIIVDRWNYFQKDMIGKMLNGYRKSIGNVSEPEITYEVQASSKPRTPNDQ